MSLPCYMAIAQVDDADRIAKLGDAMVAPEDKNRFVCLVQCGPSSDAAELSKALERLGRRTTALVVNDREQAQSDGVLAKLAGASAVWVFTDDLFDAFFSLFATQLAFALRTNARDGLPVIGVGAGAMAMGGLLLAHRVCGNAQYDLVSGLGWGQRVLIECGPNRPESDQAVVHASVSSLPGLLGVDLGIAGGIRVEGGQIESVGTEPIRLFGAGDSKGTLLTMPLKPGSSMRIAPPPFAPFERGMLSLDALNALAERKPSPNAAQAKPRPQVYSPPVPHWNPHPPAAARDPSQVGPAGIEPTVGEPTAGETADGGRMCPMCNQIHPADGRLEEAA